MKQILIFTTPTCLPCRQMKAQLTGFSGHIKYLDMENDKEAIELAHKYAVSKAPTCLFMVEVKYPKDEKNFYPVESISGYSQAIIRKIKDFLND